MMHNFCKMICPTFRALYCTLMLFKTVEACYELAVM